MIGRRGPKISSDIRECNEGNVSVFLSPTRRLTRNNVAFNEGKIQSETTSWGSKLNKKTYYETCRKGLEK